MRSHFVKSDFNIEILRQNYIVIILILILKEKLQLWPLPWYKRRLTVTISPNSLRAFNTRN